MKFLTHPHVGLTFVMLVVITFLVGTLPGWA